jgi:hypothetical protein
MLVELLESKDSRVLVNCHRKTVLAEKTFLLIIYTPPPRLNFYVFFIYRYVFMSTLKIFYFLFIFLRPFSVDVLKVLLLCTVSNL